MIAAFLKAGSFIDTPEKMLYSDQLKHYFLGGASVPQKYRTSADRILQLS